MSLLLSNKPHLTRVNGEWVCTAHGSVMVGAGATMLGAYTAFVIGRRVERDCERQGLEPPSSMMANVIERMH